MVKPMPKNPLQSLHDIHLPDPIYWWPLAPGWYVLTSVFFLLLLITGWFALQRYKNARPKRHALRLLQTYKQQYQEEKNPQLTCARVSELLKRVALAYFPREKVASLSGDQWLLFLHQTGRNTDFMKLRHALLVWPYQRIRPHPGDETLNQLLDTAHHWIAQRSKRCGN